jgi:hypothetical protein
MMMRMVFIKRIIPIILITIIPIIISESNYPSEYRLPKTLVAFHNIQDMRREENLSNVLFSPYMSIGGSAPSYDCKSVTILDTLLTQPLPDSIEIRFETRHGDNEKLWLLVKESELFPGTIKYFGQIPAEDLYPPQNDDGILQMDCRSADFVKVSYRSFIDDKMYSLRLEWFQPE